MLQSLNRIHLSIKVRDFTLLSLVRELKICKIKKTFLNYAILVQKEILSEKTMQYQSVYASCLVKKRVG